MLHPITVFRDHMSQGGTDMPHYQVSLYRDLLSSDGHPFHCLQAVIDVDADAPEGAVRIALKDMRGPARDWSIEVAEHPQPSPAESHPAAKLA
jgi:hypothetical protein